VRVPVRVLLRRKAVSQEEEEKEGGEAMEAVVVEVAVLSRLMILIRQMMELQVLRR